MNYGVENREFIVTMSYSSEGMLSGGKRSNIIIFKDTDSGEEIDLGEEDSRILRQLLKKYYI